jgi:hypothetical protein
MKDNEIDIACVTHSEDGEIIVIFLSANLEGRRFFGACVHLEVDCDLETARSRQGFSCGITHVR